MNLPAVAPQEDLPTLIQRAADALLSAKSYGEVLEAKTMASVAFAVAKEASRIAKAKEAHDSLLAQVYRAQADALGIEARAKMRLADEYDAAQERGEVASASGGGDRLTTVGRDNGGATAAEIGLRRDQIHEARQLRDAERADPGRTQRILDDMVERRVEPTKAALKPPKPEERVNQKSLWVWGRLRDFERDGYIAAGADEIINGMTEPMRADVRRLAGVVAEFIAELEQKA